LEKAKRIRGVLENYSYGLTLLIPAAISSGLAFYAWRKRAILGAVPIFFITLALVFWCLGYAFELGVPSLSAKLFWAKLQYFSIVLIPVMLLVFSLQYTGRGIWVTRRNIVLLLLVPLVILTLTWTNELHLMIWKKFYLDTASANPVLRLEYGAGFWVHVIYSYLALLLGALLLAQAFFRSQGVYKMQSFILLLGALAPWFGNALHLAGWDLFNQLDLTPFAFTITGLCYSWGQFRFQLFDLVPVARDALIENMSDAVIVVDARSRIVDVNPAARDLIGSQHEPLIGQPAAQVFSHQSDLISVYQDTLQTHTELFLGKNEAQRLFDLRISPIYDRRANLTARLIVLRDISDRWHAEEAVQRARDELELRVEERTAEIRAANIQLQQEISEKQTTARALTYRLKLEELVTGISTRFINLEPAETDREINCSLQLIGEFAQVDRSYVFRFSEGDSRMENTHEWCAPGIPSHLDSLKSICADRFPWWVGKLKQLEPINIPHVNGLQAEAAVEKEFLETQDIQSLVVVPMLRGGCLVGFLGLDSVRRSLSRDWLNEDITLLKMVGEVFVNALERNQAALERKRAAEQIEASLQEKELLLKEIHHRVKNNLQIISSLLNLQAGTVHDSDTLEILRESQNRVRAMGFIHEKLYQSENLANIDFASYIENLANYLFTTYNAGRQGTSLAFEVDKIHLGVDAAVPCGLIINELVSNALKHAYPQGAGGEIRIELKRLENTLIRLTVSDQGAGFPEGVDFRETPSLGLQLVCSLVDQLDGLITLSREAGTRFEITFSAP
jgi:PAS domain S-box-containing protein